MSLLPVFDSTIQEGPKVRHHTSFVALYTWIRASSTFFHRSESSHFLPSVRLRKIKRWPNRDDSRGINFRVGHVVMTLDVVEVHGVDDAGLLIQIH